MGLIDFNTVFHGNSIFYTHLLQSTGKNYEKRVTTCPVERKPLYVFYSLTENVRGVRKRLSPII
jgi:hypothetical protein